MSNFLASKSLQLRGVAENTSQQFLRLDLDRSCRVMLPIAQITEVLKIKLARVVPIPQMPPWVMGVYNWRGDILWIVDLAHLLGLNSWDKRGQFAKGAQRNGESQRAIGFGEGNVVILSPNKAVPLADEIHLGLVVYRVEDLEECNPKDIQPTLDKTVAIEADFASGYWLKSEREIVAILDGNAIARAMPTQAD